MRFSDLEGQRIGVWGAGREIRSFAGQLRKRCPRARIVAIATDQTTDASTEDLAATHGAQIVPAEAAAEKLGGCDLVVRSPGVSIHRPELQELYARGTTITTATALWLADRQGRNVIGVTGTKGKSTTASLLHHMVRAVGLDAHLAGNIGAPALDLLDVPSTELAVVELSSYQIADLEVGPEIALVTNLYDEHVDWHVSHEIYRAEKLRLLGLPGVRSSVLNARDSRLLAAARSATTPTLYGCRDGWDVGSKALTFRGAHVVDLEELPLPGTHNALNICAALAALQVHGAPTPHLPEALDGFATLPHRLETVCDRDGVLWIDDSISTTPESTIAAIASFENRDIVLLGGGDDRDQDYSQLASMLAEREATLIGLPVTGSRLIAAALEAGLDSSRCSPARDMTHAVSLARSMTRPGSVVLLSPAGPSYHAYRNFEERGAHFRNLIAPG